MSRYLRIAHLYLWRGEFDRIEAGGHNLEMFGGPAHRVRHVAGLLVSLALGCGALNCGKATPESRDPTPTAETAPAAADGEKTSGARTGPHLAPAFNDEVLAARVEAQRRTLGRGNLFEDEKGRPVEAIIEDTETSSFPEESLLDALPGSAGPIGESGIAEHHTNGNSLGIYVPIENPPEGPALAHFHEALRRLEAGEDPDGKVRVMIYGASHTQADVYPGYIRTYLQSRFGNGGYGHVALARVNKWFKYLSVGVESKGWKIEHAQRKERRKDGYWGLLGASASSTGKKDFGRIYPRGDDIEAFEASRYDIAYLAQPGGGEFEVFVDGKSYDTVDTSAKVPSAGHFEFELEHGAHEIEVRPTSNKEVRIYGLILERQESGVVIDTLGISGTRAANMLRWDEEQWVEAVQRRDPDLYTLYYGTNESNDLEQPIGKYRSNLVKVMQRFKRAAPDASCILIGPGDVPRKVEEGVWVPRPRLSQIVDVQREVAFEMGCGFWDSRAFMGGINSMHVWATSKPRMASRDHVHFTRRGYVRLAMALTDAMMADFDR
jgi:hypothetical protein